ncbi:MAG: hypothetical protein AAFR17_18325 [Pseudomonadota bacterium]
MVDFNFIDLSTVLENDTIAQVRARVFSTTLALEYAVLIRRGTDGTVVSTRDIASPIASRPVEDFFIAEMFALSTGGFALVFEPFDDGPLLLQRFSPSGTALGQGVRLGSTRQTETAFLDGSIALATGETILSFSDTQDFSSFDSFATTISPTGQVGPVRRLDGGIFGDGVGLEDGRFVTASSNLALRDPQILLEVFDANFRFSEQAATPTEDLTRDGDYAIDFIQLEPLPIADRFVASWTQSNESNQPSGLFFGFGDLTGADIDQGLTNIVKVDTNVGFSAFDVLTFEDGSFVLGWIGEATAGGNDIANGQAFWRHFDSNGRPLSPIRDAISGPQVEVDIDLAPLDGVGEFLITLSRTPDVNNGSTLTRVVRTVDLEKVPQLLSALGDRFTGTAQDDFVNADDGNDILDLRGGDDTVLAGQGNDSVNAGAGDDSVSGGFGNDMIFGFGGNDILRGNAGDDLLNGGSGGDVLDGGDGLDTADYSDANGRVRADLQGAVSGTGAAAGDTFSGIENLTGSRRDDVLFGDGGDNILRGGNFFDRLTGRAGDDTILGEGGADAIAGNTGQDIMTGGGAGRDRFIYFNIADSRPGFATRDRITDFTAGEDRIEIGRFDADETRGGNQAFEFIGSDFFSGDAGELRFVQTATRTLVRADIDGDKATDFEIELTGQVDLTAGDFVL